MGRTEFQTWILTTSEPGLAEQKQQLQRDEMALFHERMLKYARKLLDTADIVIALGKAWKRRNRR
jgi:hypothetical protein